MFEALTQWQWVAIAWTHLLLSYAAYLGYLSWRANRVRRHAETAEVESSRN